MGHAAVLLGDSILVIGGRTSPVGALNDVWSLDCLTWQWQQLHPCVASFHNGIVCDCSSSSSSSSSSVKPVAKRQESWPGRFRHAAAAVDGRVYVFGGRSGDQLLDDFWVLHQAAAEKLGQQQDRASPGPEGKGWIWTKLPAVAVAAAAGSAAPAQCWPSARKSHVMAAAAGKLYLHGGTSTYGRHFGDMFCLNLCDVDSFLLASSASASSQLPQQQPGAHGLSWRLVPGRGTPPPACFSHTLTPWNSSNCLLLAGGHPSRHHDSVFTFHVASETWCRLPVQHAPSSVGEFVPIRHSAAILPLSAPAADSPCREQQQAVIRQQQQPGQQQQGQQHATFVEQQQQQQQAPVMKQQQQWQQQQQKAPVMEQQGQGQEALVLMGGGAFCFSFGSIFSSPWMLPLQQLQQEMHNQQQQQAEQRQQAQDPHPGSMLSPPGSSAAAHGPNTVGERTGVPGSSSSSGGAACWVLEVPASLAKSAKDAIKSEGWLDQSKKAGRQQQQQQEDRAVLLPLLPHGAQAIRAGMTGSSSSSSTAGTCDATAGSSSSTAAAPGTLLPQALVEVLAGGARLYQQQLPSSCRVGLDPKEAMKAAVLALLLPEAAALPPDSSGTSSSSGSRDGRSVPAADVLQELLEDLPVKWEKLGDLALIPANSMQHHAWRELVPEQGLLWQAVAGALGVSRLARQATVANTGTRDSQAALLLGSDGWVAHREGGVTFCLDVTRCMYSSGNVTERMRMGRMDCSGQTIVDLYTGVGYYTLPLLVHGSAAKVYACEWNPHAIQALRRNLEVNQVATRCEVLQGDCRQVAPKGVADRVLLGLLPSSQGGWPAAVAALKEEGGWLHVHENVRDVEEAAWVQQAAATMQQLAHRLPGRSCWEAAIRHVERVKWYAPHIRHIVVDMELRPRGG